MDVHNVEPPRANHSQKVQRSTFHIISHCCGLRIEVKGPWIGGTWALPSGSHELPEIDMTKNINKYLIFLYSPSAPMYCVSIYISYRKYRQHTYIYTYIWCFPDGLWRCNTHLSPAYLSQFILVVLFGVLDLRTIIIDVSWHHFVIFV